MSSKYAPSISWPACIISIAKWLLREPLATKTFSMTWKASQSESVWQSQVFTLSQHRMRSSRTLVTGGQACTKIPLWPICLASMIARCPCSSDCKNPTTVLLSTSTLKLLKRIVLTPCYPSLSKSRSFCATRHSIATSRMTLTDSMREWTRLSCPREMSTTKRSQKRLSR